MEDLSQSQNQVGERSGSVRNEFGYSQRQLANTAMSVMHRFRGQGNKTVIMVSSTTVVVF